MESAVQIEIVANFLRIFLCVGIYSQKKDIACVVIGCIGTHSTRSKGIIITKLGANNAFTPF